MQQRIKPSAEVSPKAIIHEGVTVDSFSIIGDDVEIGPNTHIGPYCRIEGPTKIGADCNFLAYASIGAAPQDLKYQGEPTRLVIGDNNTFREFVTINRGTVQGGGVTTIGSGNLVMAYCHVAHDCVVGNNVVMGNLATLAGHVTVEDRVILGGHTAIHQFTRIGANVITGGGSMVSLDLVPYAKASGNRAKIFGVNSVGLKRCGFSPEAIKAIGQSYRTLFRKGLLLKDALATIIDAHGDIPEVMRLVDFIKASERGIARQ